MRLGLELTLARADEVVEFFRRCNMSGIGCLGTVIRRYTEGNPHSRPDQGWLLTAIP